MITELSVKTIISGSTPSSQFCYTDKVVKISVLLTQKAMIIFAAKRFVEFFYYN